MSASTKAPLTGETTNEPQIATIHLYGRRGHAADRQRGVRAGAGGTGLPWRRRSFRTIAFHLDAIVLDAARLHGDHARGRCAQLVNAAKLDGPQRDQSIDDRHHGRRHDRGKDRLEEAEEFRFAGLDDHRPWFRHVESEHASGHSAAIVREPSSTAIRPRAPRPDADRPKPAATPRARAWSPRTGDPFAT